jgi:hypothetical protein
MTLRDRYAKNFAEALDFTQRRPAIDLPPYDPPPARACALAAGGSSFKPRATAP